ncbi:MAG: hypothetical protein K9L32_05830 [Chromatiaceae bacterium]|nr:hypothetical protein [Chromatiaceae bacterium]
MSPDHTQLSLTALMVQPHPDVAATSPDAINVTAQQTKPHRRPLVPMNASEAISMVFVELGLLILLADNSGLILIAVGVIGYVYARLTYRPPLARYPLD